LTDEQSGSSSAPCVKKYVRKRLAVDRKRREQECIVILVRAYIDVLSKLNGDVREAFKLFDKFTKTAAKAPVPRKGRGKADPALDTRILAAGDAAPHGQKEAAVAEAAGAKTAREIDAARKRYSRLCAERDAHEKWVAKVVGAVRSKLRLGSPQRLFKSTVPAPPLDDPVEGDKYAL
jgi:hypothetical protein